MVSLSVSHSSSGESVIVSLKDHFSVLQQVTLCLPTLPQHHLKRCAYEKKSIVGYLF